MVGLWQQVRGVACAHTLTVVVPSPISVAQVLLCQPNRVLGVGASGQEFPVSVGLAALTGHYRRVDGRHALSVLGAGSSRSQCWQTQCLVGAASWFIGGISLLCPDTGQLRALGVLTGTPIHFPRAPPS